MGRNGEEKKVVRVNNVSKDIVILHMFTMLLQIIQTLIILNVDGSTYSTLNHFIKINFYLFYIKNSYKVFYLSDNMYSILKT